MSIFILEQKKLQKVNQNLSKKIFWGGTTLFLSQVVISYQNEDN